MTRADRRNSQMYSYAQRLRYDENIDIKRDRILVKKINKVESVTKAPVVITSLYQLFKER